jgi:glycosyltransferase involved in cell wall biosynthesis
MLLSICMPTLNRASFIGETLDSIVPQLRDDMEVVVVDGGSGDGTADVVGRRSAACPRIRYHLATRGSEGSPKPSNSGYDRDCDAAVQLARGRYCWLLPDDDLVVPGALETLRRYLESEVALIVVNAEVRSSDLSCRLVPQRMVLGQDATFARGEASRLMKVAGRYLSYAGGVIVRRDWWMARDRERYYGSGFIHVATLFQAPGDLDAVVVAKPLIWVRYGNALWTDRAFMIWMFHWPELIWGLPMDEEAKRAVVPREPWTQWARLVLYRARGIFNRPEYRLIRERKPLSLPTRVVAATIAWIPGRLLNLLGLIGLFLAGRRRSLAFVDLWLSPNNLLGRLFRGARP